MQIGDVNIPNYDDIVYSEYLNLVNILDNNGINLFFLQSVLLLSKLY